MGPDKELRSLLDQEEQRKKKLITCFVCQKPILFDAKNHTVDENGAGTPHYRHIVPCITGPID